MRWFSFALTFGLAALSSAHAQGQTGAKKDDKLPAKVSYYKDVRPIFQQHCQGCHQPAQAKGGYVMTSHADLLKKSDSDAAGVVAGQPTKSELFLQIVPEGKGKKARMPQGKDPLSDREVAVIKQWITQGAQDDTPISAKGPVVDMEHPPTYVRSPVINGVDFSPDGKLLAVTGYHEVLIHKADGSGLVARLVGLAERVQSVAFSPDSKYLAATGGDPGRFGEVQVWDVAKQKLKKSIPVSFDTVYGARWSNDGKLISFGCADNSVRAVDPETGKQVLFQGGHNDWVVDTVFSKTGSHLISVSRDRSMKLTEVATQRLEDNITSITPGALKGGLQTVDRHPSKEEVLAGGADGTPKTYQIFRTKARQIGDDFNLIRSFPSMPGRIFATRYSHDGKKIVAGSSSTLAGEVRTYETDTGKQIAQFEKIRGPIYTVAFRPDGQVVASAGFAGVVWLHDAQTGKVIREFVPCPLKSGKK